MIGEDGDTPKKEVPKKPVPWWNRDLLSLGDPDPDVHKKPSGLDRGVVVIVFIIGCISWFDGCGRKKPETEISELRSELTKAKQTIESQKREIEDIERRLHQRTTPAESPAE